jgi:hypothetical protein
VAVAMALRDQLVHDHIEHRPGRESQAGGEKGVRELEEEEPSERGRRLDRAGRGSDEGSSPTRNAGARERCGGRKNLPSASASIILVIATWSRDIVAVDLRSPSSSPTAV